MSKIGNYLIRREEADLPIPNFSKDYSINNEPEIPEENIGKKIFNAVVGKDVAQYFN